MHAKLGAREDRQVTSVISYGVKSIHVRTYEVREPTGGVDADITHIYDGYFHQAFTAIREGFFPPAVIGVSDVRDRRV